MREEYCVSFPPEICIDSCAKTLGSIQMIERFYDPLAGEIYVRDTAYIFDGIVD